MLQNYINSLHRVTQFQYVSTIKDKIEVRVFLLNFCFFPLLFVLVTCLIYLTHADQKRNVINNLKETIIILHFDTASNSEKNT